MKESKLKKVGYSKFCQHAKKNSEAMKSHNKKQKNQLGNVEVNVNDKKNKQTEKVK